MGLSNVSYQTESDPQREWVLPPIRGIEVYANDVVVKRFGHKTKVNPEKRQKVKEFSLPARKRLAFVAANTKVDFRSMITLTYPAIYPHDGRLVKRDRKVFLQWLCARCPDCSYLWFIEFQRRGAPHFHILFTEQIGGLPAYRKFQMEVSEAWNRIVKGDIDHLRAGTRTERLRTPEGGRHYAVKYAIKMRQKLVPAAFENVGRFYGYSRDVTPKPIAGIALGWAKLKAMLEDWPYLPDNERDLYKVLYNTSGVVAPYIVQDRMFFD
jgi:hypothetical protein